MDKELSNDYRVTLQESRLAQLEGEPTIMRNGALILTISGEVQITANFLTWKLLPHNVFILFPGDMVQVQCSPDFRCEVLSYDQSTLREASLQLEHTIYTMLRTDRGCGNQAVVSELVSHLFGVLHIFFRSKDCTCTRNVVLFQLQTFFIGFYDYLKRHPEKVPAEEGSRRVNELFNEFMRLVASQYMISRDVSYYANQLNISSKYLNQIVNRKTLHNPKNIIDHYVILQLKMMLRTSKLSIKQIAWQCHFSDDSFFCRYFKQHTGLSPQQYRNSQNSDASLLTR